MMLNAGEWLNSLPASWKASRLKFCATKIGSGVTPRGGSERYKSEGIALLRSQNVYDDGLRLDDVAYIDAETDQAMSRTRVRYNDVLLNITGASIGRTCIVPASALPANVNQHVCIIRPSRMMVPAFLSYVLKSQIIREQILSIENGASREGLNYEQVGNLWLPLPNRAEQSSIGTFLDAETSEIEAILARYVDLIKLLTERLEASVTERVTKGLNPDVQTKDSSVPWLAQIPEHWTVSRLKYAVNISSGSTPDKGDSRFWQDGTIPWASAKDLKVDVLLDTEDHITTSAIASGVKIIPKGVVLIVVRGMILSRLLPVTLTGKAMAINQDLKALRPRKALRPEYLALVLRSIGKAIIATADTSGHGTKVLRTQDWTRFEIPVPPIHEQDQIVQEVDRQAERINELIGIIKKGIEICNERRVALITAAVTGQINLKSYREKLDLAQGVA